MQSKMFYKTAKKVWPTFEASTFRLTLPLSSKTPVALSCREDFCSAAPRRSAYYTVHDPDLPGDPPHMTYTDPCT